MSKYESYPTDELEKILANFRYDTPNAQDRLKEAEARLRASIEQHEYWLKRNEILRHDGALIEEILGRRRVCESSNSA